MIYSHRNRPGVHAANRHAKADARATKLAGWKGSEVAMFMLNGFTLCGLMTLAVLTLSVIVHVATFISGVPISMSQAWPLHLGAIGSIFIFAMAMKTQTVKARMAADRIPPRDMMKLTRRYTPRLLRWFCNAAFLYVLVNFGLFMYWSAGDGSPTAVNGHYELRKKGAPAKIITQQEYDDRQALIVRGFSGHWIVMSLYPTVFFLVALPAIANGYRRY